MNDVVSSAGLITDPLFDAAIVGGGVAGLMAAVWLGRCQRKTLLIDSGSPRNAASLGLHGYLTRDGVLPADLRAMGRRELTAYPSVKIIDGLVVAARRSGAAFEFNLRNGGTHRAKTLLLATGRTDTLPDLPDVRTFYGRGIFHCPYCDGWEHRGLPVAVLGDGRAALEAAELLTTWTSDISVFTHGVQPRDELAAAALPIVPARITRLCGNHAGRLTHVEFANGEIRECQALFFSSDCCQKSALPEALGCRFDEEGSVTCEAHAATGVPGLFVAGNVRGGIHLAIMAAAEGAEAALAINEYLLEHARAARR